MPDITGPAAPLPDVALLRVSTDPGGLDLPEILATSEPALAAWLAATWQRADIRTAITIASPALSAQVDDLIANSSPDPHRARRIARAVASYLLRWQHRATPFGLFAAVGAACIGGRARVLVDGYRLVARADATWLGAILARLHDCPELMGRVPVVATDAGIIRGGRLVILGHPSHRVPSELAPVVVSMALTSPVRAALEAAREPVVLRDLASELNPRFPAVAPAQVAQLLSGLIAHGVLVSTLRAPMSCLDALGHLNDQLRKVRADEIQAISGLALCGRIR